MRKTSLVVLALVLATSFLVRGAAAQACPCDLSRPGIFYVVPAGGWDDGPGSLDQPFATLWKALEVAPPGSVIYLRGGLYLLDAGLRIRHGGTENNPTIISAFPGEKPIFDGAAMTETGYYSGWVVDILDVSWLHLVGIEIRNGPSGGLVMRGLSHDNVIENLDVHHNGRLSMGEGKGITLYGPAFNNLLLHNDSHHNRDITGENADGFQIAVTGTGNIVRGNRAWRNSDDGFDFFNVFDNVDDAPVLIEHNYSWENGYDDNLQPIGDGVGFKLGGTRPGSTGVSGGHTVRFNLAFRNTGEAFANNGASVPSILYDNRTEPAPWELSSAFGPPPAW